MSTLWADPNSIAVTVQNGVVAMVGRLERRGEVLIAGRLALKVPGVIKVHNRLNYTWNYTPEQRP